MAEVVSRKNFRGNNVTRVDDKNRLKLAAEFKRLVDEKCGPEAEFYITSMDGERAYLYPIKEWEAKEAILAGLPASDPTRVKFQRWTSYYGAEVRIDGQGRLLLPSPLREDAKLTGEVVVLGCAGAEEPGFLEVVNHEKFKADMKRDQFTTEDMAKLAALKL
jgi:MraZ protein